MLIYQIKCKNLMITGHSDPLMCFYAHNLACISIESTAKPGGAMLPLAPPLLPHSKTRGCTAPPCSPPLASLIFLDICISAKNEA